MSEQQECYGIQYCPECHAWTDDCPHQLPYRNPAQVIAHIEDNLPLPVHKIKVLAKGSACYMGYLEAVQDIMAMFESDNQ
jgi:hypothetical protein